MYELTSEQEAILAECLQAMEEGQGLEACLAKLPQHAQALRPFLHLHAELADIEVPEPSAALYQAGRDALLLAVAGGGAGPGTAPIAVGAVGGSLAIGLASLTAAARDWVSRGARVVGRPAVPGLVAAALVVLVGGGALGASAAAGFEPAQAVLSSLGMMDGVGEGDGKNVDNGDKDDEPAPHASTTGQPDEKKTPVSVIAPKATPTDKPDQPGPTDKPEATAFPTKQPERPRPSPTRVAAPTQEPDPQPIAVDLGDICIPLSVYQQNTGLHAYEVKICSIEEVTYLKDTFVSGLCLPKVVADAYPSMADLGINPCLPKQEEHIEQFLFVEEWCAPDKAADLLTLVGAGIPPCTPHKVKVTLLWLKDNDPCRIDWLVPPLALVCS